MSIEGSNYAPAQPLIWQTLGDDLKAPQGAWLPPNGTPDFAGQLSAALQSFRYAAFAFFKQDTIARPAEFFYRRKPRYLSSVGFARGIEKRCMAGSGRLSFWAVYLIKLFLIMRELWCALQR